LLNCTRVIKKTICKLTFTLRVEYTQVTEEGEQE
jgi:hypothetical protein